MHRVSGEQIRAGRSTHLGRTRSDNNPTLSSPIQKTHTSRDERAGSRTTESGLGQSTGKERVKSPHSAWHGFTMSRNPLLILITPLCTCNPPSSSSWYCCLLSELGAYKLHCCLHALTPSVQAVTACPALPASQPVSQSLSQLLLAKQAIHPTTQQAGSSRLLYLLPTHPAPARSLARVLACVQRAHGPDWVSSSQISAMISTVWPVRRQQVTSAQSPRPPTSPLLLLGPLDPSK